MRFTIKWTGSEYKVSIPNYEGGEVVSAEDYDQLVKSSLSSQQGFEKIFIEKDRRIEVLELSNRDSQRLLNELNWEIAELQKAIASRFSPKQEK